MKKLLPIIILCCLTSLVFAQPDKADRAKIEELKVSFITDKLDLTVEEAQEFWPIFNQQEKELRNLRKSLRTAEKKSFDDMSDAELEQRILKRFEMQRKEVDIREKYFPKLKTALPMKKLARLPLVEKRFKQLLLEKIRGRK